MTTPTCRYASCTNAHYAAGACRRHREQEIHGGPVSTHTVGDVQHLMRRIIDHYPTAREAIKTVGISYESYYRIMRSDTRATLKTPTYRRIIAAARNLDGAPAEKTTGITRAEVAAYALTTEGQAFIAECLAPKQVAA
ncbi:hypothetical protein [Brevibacterium sp. ZH18]|uniref:hypothetical protein n=1 Tax=Brevibacterium sp. ZH18 TaxID=2927784 RepID=UPI001F61439B|nr:hypothetical protein [Brevibacterium sp. ZH18]MCI4012349.1 hypothetical protein [Brevibacterium sp. ZH18]